METITRKGIARLEVALAKAEARCARLTERYRDLGCKLYRETDVLFRGKPIVDTRIYHDYEFISWQCTNRCTHERDITLYRKTRNGYREVSPATWDKIERLECAILDAWERYNDALWLLREARQCVESKPATDYPAGNPALDVA